jgi:hypothetical protein
LFLDAGDDLRWGAFIDRCHGIRVDRLQVEYCRVNGGGFGFKIACRLFLFADGRFFRFNFSLCAMCS